MVYIEPPAIAGLIINSIPVVEFQIALVVVFVRKAIENAFLGTETS